MIVYNLNWTVVINIWLAYYEFCGIVRVALSIASFKFSVLQMRIS